MKTFNRFITLLFLVSCCVLHAWGADAPTLSDLDFGTPSYSENFNSVSPTSTTAIIAIATTQSSYGAINHIYNNNAANTFAISASGNNMGSNYMSLTSGSGSPLIGQISGGSFSQKGVWRATIEKTSRGFIGLYNDASAASASDKAKVSAYIQNANGTITIQNGSSSSNWEAVGSSSNNTIDICVIYNLTDAEATYGGSITLGSMKAHVYIDGTCVNTSGTPTAFTLRNNSTVTAFRVATGTNGNHMYVDDIKIYNSLPTAASGGTCATPTFSPVAGTYSTTQYVTISSATDGATIYYTTNGDTPSALSTPYSGPITVSSTQTIKAIAIKANHTNSEVATATYTIVPPKTVTFSGGEGTITETTPGEGVKLPTPAVTSCDGWTFYGWSETNVSSETTTVPTLVGVAGDTYIPGTDKTLYPVYRKEELLNTYTKITSSGALVSGANYVILYNDEYALDASKYYYSKGDGYFGVTSPSISYSTITNPSANLIWQLSGDNTNGWSIYNSNSNKYVGYSTTYNDIYADATSHPDFTVTYSYGFYIQAKAASSHYFSAWRYNLSGGGGKAYFFEGENTETRSVNLYKQNGTIKYLSNPSCTSCANTITVSKGSETNGNTFTLSRTGSISTCAGARSIVVTPSPAPHYSVGTVTVTGPTSGTATVTGPSDGKYTVTYSANATGATTINVSFEATPTYTVTLNPTTPAHGTTSLESAGITFVTIEDGEIVSLWATPDDCYTLGSISITPADGYSELEANGENKWQIIGITENLEVAVTYASLPLYTVTIDPGTGTVPGDVTTFPQASCGGSVTLPSASSGCESDPTSPWTFAGWSRTKVTVESETPPVLIPAGSFTPTASETLYAVYKIRSGEGSAYWVKAKDVNTLSVGDSVMIGGNTIYNSTDWLVISTTQNDNNRGSVAITRSVTGDTIASYTSAAAKFILQNGVSSGTYAFYDPDKKGYLYGASGGNYLRTKTDNSTNGSWSISINSISGVATLTTTVGETVKNLKRNGALFSCYTSDQTPVCLYVKSAGTLHYTSLPSCTPCVDPEASLSSTSVSMTVDKSVNITLTSENANAVTATSANTSIATVSVTGKTITVNGITEGETTITVQQAREGEDPTDHCAVLLELAVSVTTATIEIIEWEREAVIIEYDGANDAQLVLGKEVEHGSKTATMATELFFSKYFEAAGEDKLFGVYNGTGEKRSLAGYTVQVVFSDGVQTIDLSAFGKETGYIDDKEEIIIYRYGGTGYSRDCMKDQEGYEDWTEYPAKAMQFSGTQSLGLYKLDKSSNDSLIDIIGATYSTAVGGHTAGELVLLDKVADGGIAPSWGDESGFNAETCGDNISTDDIETNYGLSTNRCLLIRKNTVKSGADAVRLNTTSSTDDATRAAAFETLCSEWGGLHVPASEDKVTSTCNGMGYVAGFDYSNYYVTMETFNDTTKIGKYDNGDGTYTIPVEDLDTLACRLVRIQLTKDGKTIASSDPKVPIVIDEDHTTSDEVFYKHTLDTCKICDVVIRNSAKLTKSEDKTENDRPNLRDITVYAGSQLIIPETGTDLQVNNIILRSKDDVVSTASFDGGIQFKATGNKVYHSKRMQKDRWYWFCLPYDCQTNKVTWQDGTTTHVGVDWHIKYYDGAQRAATQAGGCWKEFTGSTIQAGQGYILSVEERVGHTYRELIFPMDTLSEGSTNKTVMVDDYGAGEDITPNHKGWNLVGNPYMTFYSKNHIKSGGKNPALTVGKLESETVRDESDPEHVIITHTYSINTESPFNVPYVTVPVDHGESEYSQVALMDYDLPPFISYFVQIGGAEAVAAQQYVTFYKGDLTNTTTDLIPASYVRRRAAEEADPLKPIWLTLHLENNKHEYDETTLVISDLYTQDYEIGSDLGKMFGSNFREYSKPICYSKSADGSQMAFQAIPDSAALEWTPIAFWGVDTQPITVSIRRQNRDLDDVESVMLYDKTLNKYTELLENDYVFSPTKKALFASRLYLRVKVKRPSPSIATGLDNVHEGVYAYSNYPQQLVVAGLPEKATVWIYDALGHLVAYERTNNYMRTYSLPTTGVYFVRVMNEEGQRTLRTIVK